MNSFRITVILQYHIKQFSFLQIYYDVKFKNRHVFCGLITKKYLHAPSRV